MKILLVEDDEVTARSLGEILTADNYIVDVATDGETGRELIACREYDLLILDIGIPKLNGLSLCKRVRAKGDRLPILLLTARDSNEEMIAGLDAGADDYLTKPFDISLLLARVRALLRRGYPIEPSFCLTRGRLSLDTAAGRVLYDRRAIELRRKEYQLLELFLRHRERVFSRDAILDRLWTSDDFPSEGAVTNLIKDLRQRLKGAGIDEEIIETVYGAGYRLKKELETAKKKENSQISPKIFEEIERASGWFRESLPGRIGKLEAIARRWRSGTLNTVDRETAKEEAHKLIGALGTFGFQDGVEPARRMETLLADESPLSPDRIEDFTRQVNALKAIVSPVPIESQPDDAKATALVIGIAANISELLQPWGIHVVYLDKVAEFSEFLATIAPDILLLDAEYPDVDPIAFCRSLRQDARRGDLPVLVLTERDDPEFLRQLFEAGADDFIVKPALGPELVSRAVNHIDRARGRRRESRSEIDSLTELVARRSFDRQLPLFWAQREREKSPLSLLLCEIDHLSHYNRQNGYEAGDTCLRRLARELENHADPARDLLARYGGDSFALLLPETPVDGAVRVAEAIVRAIATLEISPAVTASVGITATIPTPARTIPDFLTAAEQALYTARWRGGNTYCLYPL